MILCTMCCLEVFVKLFYCLFFFHSVAIHGVLRWLRRVWTLCHEHMAVCREGGSWKEEEGEEKRKIIAATHRAIQQVIKCVWTLYGMLRQ